MCACAALQRLQVLSHGGPRRWLHPCNPSFSWQLAGPLNLASERASQKATHNVESAGAAVRVSSHSETPWLNEMRSDAHGRDQVAKLSAILPTRGHTWITEV